MDSGFDLLFNLGTFEIGSTVSSFLLGTTTSQAYTYYRRYPRDPLSTRILVGTILFLEVCHTAATIQSFFTVSILNYNQPEKIFEKSPVGYTLSILLSGLIASLVQVYFANRARIITQKTWFTALAWALSLVRFMGTIWLTVLIWIMPWLDFLRQWRWVAIVVWTIGAVVDVLIAGFMSLDLIRKRREATQSKRILDRIIAATVQTGLLTSATTIAIAVCFVAMPLNFVWGAIGATLAKLFSISLFASLNARERLNRESLVVPPRLAALQLENGLAHRPRAHGELLTPESRMIQFRLPTTPSDTQQEVTSPVSIAVRATSTQTAFPHDDKGRTKSYP
ncbi:hypothetical protein BDN72DRAFT_956978 [Pluteus cervinus]|uniref:Uncharacterized protein n=1 Tax=Pluteus cervinus TaxID=181527 RepID=A0ACD3B4R2_9AGAR|nr:hypothetical protein BDN72DRAFT_956978 [Pluteus cervinus]